MPGPLGAGRQEDLTARPHQKRRTNRPDHNCSSRVGGLHWRGIGRWLGRLLYNEYNFMVVLMEEFSLFSITELFYPFYDRDTLGVHKLDCVMSSLSRVK